MLSAEKEFSKVQQTQGCVGGVSCATCDTCGGGCQYAVCENGCCHQKLKKDSVVGPHTSFEGTQYSNFTLSNKEQLRGTTGLDWREQQGPLGDFYAGRYDFVDDNPPESNLEHSYGMGKGFGFAGGESNGDYISYNDFIDEVP